ncbi:MAG: tetratricopeptide repeat protein, partial [bacterium]
RLAGRRRGPPLLAGIFAALYGTLVFFDGDLLMITLVIFFGCSSVLLLAAGNGGPRSGEDRAGGTGDGGPRQLGQIGERRAGRKRFPVWLIFLLAGVSLGFAGLGKPNVLLFAPFGLLWILTGFEKRYLTGRWRSGVLFVAGVVLAVMPITVRNYIVSGDFVLVSSNAGVNFFIGNNDQASGIFNLPPGSGLDNARLYLSSRDAAEQAMGREKLKPSEVSRYWSGRAVSFLKERPGEALRLSLRKFLLFWNHYEIPNHHNKYFIGINYAPALEYLAVGFWLIAPLSILGIVLLMGRRESRRVFLLYVGFIAVYMLSLIPFFVTARYRLPVVPFLIVFAALGLFGLVDVIGTRKYKRAAVAVGAAAVAVVIVSWPIVDYDFGFSHTVMGTAYSELATNEPERAPEHISDAIIHFKKAIELRPLSVDAHYNLGITYQRVGYYSGAVAELEATVALDPRHRYAGKALEECRTSLAAEGDKIDARAIPKTPFEKGLEYTRSGMRAAARDQYARVLREDPHHSGAYSQLGAMAFDRGDYAEAISLFKKGLEYHPDHFVLNNNVAGAYYRKGDVEKARRYWMRCLEIRPGDEGVRRQLRLLDG